MLFGKRGSERAADTPSAASAQWYYEDVNDASKLHGPFTVDELQAWVDDGALEEDMLLRDGIDGASISLASLLRAQEYFF